MREIYSKAELTFSWLGGPEEDSAVDGLEFLREKEDWLSQLNVTLNPKRKRGWTSKGLQSPDTDEILPHDLEDVYQPYQDQKDAPVICPETAEQPLNNQEGYDVQVPMPVQPPYTASRRCKNHCKRCKIDYCFQALSDLFKREYWRRRWIIQEIAASEDVCVLCGWETLPLEELCIALSQYRTCRFWDDANEDACTFFDIAMKLRRAYQGHEDLHLGEIIPQTKNFRSRDPRDRIFALLGICSDGPQLVPTPSYHQSPEGVSRDLTRSMLRRYHCFDFLLENHRKTSNPPDMPSWALEWSSYHIPPGFTENRPDPRITRDMANSVLRGPHHILMMRGTVVGTVTGVTSSISNIFGAENQDHPMISLDVDGNSKQSRVYYQDAQSVRDALAWCLARDHPDRTRFQGQTDRSVCKRYRVALHRCARLPVSTDQKADETTDYIEDGIERPELTFRRWVGVNADFLIDGMNLQWLIKERGICYYAKLPLDFLLGRFVVGSIVAGLIACPIAFPISNSVGSIVGISFFALSVLSVFALLCPLWCLRHHWPRSYVLEPMEDIVARVATRERLASCDTGMLAMVGDDTRPADLVCQLNAFSSPVILRKFLDVEGECYELIGKAFPCFSVEDLGVCSRDFAIK